MTWLPLTAAHGKIVFERCPNGNIALFPADADTIQECREILEDPAYDPDATFAYMLREQLGNGWLLIPPEAIGAMTDAPIISQDMTIDDDGNYV